MKKRTIIILIIIGILVIITGYLTTKLMDSNSDKKQKEEIDIITVEVKKGEKLDIDPKNKSVQKLYNKIEQDFILNVYDGFETYSNNNFYMDKLVTYKDLSDSSKLYYTYQQLDNIERKWFNSCDELKGYSLNKKSLQKICSEEPLIIKKDQSSEEWFFYNVNKEKLEKAYHELYGSDKVLPKKTFTMNYNGRCIYSKELDDYLCYTVTGSNTSLNESKTKIDKVIKYNEYIEIYDRYVWIENKHQKSNYKQDYYKSHLKKELITSKTTSTSKIDEKIVESGALYKHIFKKDSNNNYYWYSSERIE